MAGGLWTRVPFRWPGQETRKIALFPLPSCLVDTPSHQSSNSGKDRSFPARNPSAPHPTRAARDCDLAKRHAAPAKAEHIPLVRVESTRAKTLRGHVEMISAGFGLPTTWSS